MKSPSNNHERVAHNTLFLYIRMFILMLINLYTTRVILKALGETDYGIHNVVSGFVAMFIMFSNTMSTAISRYITFSLGKDDTARTKSVFSNALLIQAGLALFVFIVGEVALVWFLNHKMDIPPERMDAANIVLQLALMQFIFLLFRPPFDACIVAHERMSVYAYLGIFEGLSGLIVAQIVAHSSTDRLVLYTALTVVLAVVVLALYYGFCRINFEECRLVWSPNRQLVAEMLGFSGWNFLGVMAGVMRTQGINMLLNVFCGPTVNAARGLAMQVNKAVTRFSQGFITAINPQITKNYAIGNKAEYEHLAMTGSKIAFLLSFFSSLPLVMETDTLLGLWLVKVPAHTCLFVIFILCQVMVDSFSNPLITLLLATGDIRKLTVTVSCTTLLCFPLAYLLLWLGLFPESTICGVVAISMVTLCIRLHILHEQLDFPVRTYVSRVLLVALRVVVPSVALPLLLKVIWPSTTIGAAILRIVLMEVFAFIVIVTIGLTRKERLFIINAIRKKLN